MDDIVGIGKVVSSDVLFGPKKVLEIRVKTLNFVHHILLRRRRLSIDPDLVYFPWNDLGEMFPHSWALVGCSPVEDNHFIAHPKPVIIICLQFGSRAEGQIAELEVILLETPINSSEAIGNNNKGNGGSSIRKVNHLPHSLGLNHIDFSPTDIHMTGHLQHC